MKVENTKANGCSTDVVTFDSLTEFYDYCMNTPFNETFTRASYRDSESTDSGYVRFSKTSDFEEALELFKTGWSVMAETLTKRLRVVESKQQPLYGRKSVLDVCGYQPIVPLYLNGVPNNMVGVKNVQMMQKVITINKSIDYTSWVDANDIIEESMKALQIVKRLESQGYRLNLNIVLGSVERYGRSRKGYAVKIKIKDAGERVNVSKLAFALVHPSMLRRLLFRFFEVYPGVPSSYVGNYGKPYTTDESRAMMNKGEYLLPNFIRKDIAKISSIEDLENV